MRGVDLAQGQIPVVDLVLKMEQGGLDELGRAEPKALEDAV